MNDQYKQTPGMKTIPKRPNQLPGQQQSIQNQPTAAITGLTSNSKGETEKPVQPPPPPLRSTEKPVQSAPPPLRSTEKPVQPLPPSMGDSKQSNDLR